MLTCPNCQQQVEPVDGGYTPHFDRMAETFSCPKDPRVIDPMSGELAPVEGVDVPAQSANVTQAEGIVATP